MLAVLPGCYPRQIRAKQSPRLRRVSPAETRLRKVGATGFEPATLCTPRLAADHARAITELIEPHWLDVTQASVRAPNVLGAPEAPNATPFGAPVVRGELPSALPSFLEACTNLAVSAAERGDFTRAVELMQKAAQVAALREGAA